MPPSICPCFLAPRSMLNTSHSLFGRGVVVVVVVNFVDQEVEMLKLCKSIVEDGPDLFSLHKPSVDAPFR